MATGMDVSGINLRQIGLIVLYTRYLSEPYQDTWKLTTYVETLVV
jgi:hypothetical protein